MSQTSLQIYDTQPREMVDIRAEGTEIGMYTCGPTVYRDAHIGNMRAYVTADLARRAVELAGGTMRQVLNITDVGHLTSDADSGQDKVALAARTTGLSAYEIAERYEQRFWEDYDALGLTRPEVAPRATDHIDDQIRLIQKLEARGMTYETGDGVYFDSTRFPAYAEFARLDLDGLAAGSRVDNREKRHASDFALWKRPEVEGVREMEWSSPWGIGFPGWHIECSAMALRYLGDSFDIHTGGIDHIPVHHTNEIAQARAAGYPFAQHWIHTAFLVDESGNKMSKSTGASSRLPAVLEEYHVSPETMRYLYLTNHYRQSLEFSAERVAQAASSLERLLDTAAIITKEADSVAVKPDTSSEVAEGLWKAFRSAILSDLNSPLAIDKLHEVSKAKISPSAKHGLLVGIDKVLGLGLVDKIDDVILTEQQEGMLELRARARGSRDYAAADTIRRDLRISHGIRVLDAPSGQVIRRA